ncbi:MAG: PIN domain-containing protein [Syntrophales bacterium]|nr:PIN domain-containing protein [Syntrophales bacterium]
MFLKLFLVFVCAISGFFIAYLSYPIDSWWTWPLGVLAGVLVALLVIKLEHDLRKLSVRVIIGGVIGCMVGLVIAFMFAYGLNFVNKIRENQAIIPWIYAVLTVAMGYLGIVLGARKVEELKHVGFLAPKREEEARILDTSVIIDGRIADICETGFLEGTLIVPRFVLDELQYIADSADPTKRSRGRRGLDILNRMQKMPNIRIAISDQDFPRIKGVDAKLVALAQMTGGKIITNDFNLNKVAELQGVKILNVNELANALKPIVLPGESMSVKVIKEGKEPGQGVGYLDDGTMIIVDNGQRYIGQTLEVVVTSVLQTTAGRMIFTEMKGLGEKKAISPSPRP